MSIVNALLCILISAYLCLVVAQFTLLFGMSRSLSLSSKE